MVASFRCARFLLILVLVTMSAACLGRPSPPSGIPDAGPAEHTVRIWLREPLVLHGSPAGSQVGFYQTQEDRDELGNCQAEPDELDYSWVAVWNRTGLVSYEQWEVDALKRFNASVTLPPHGPWLLIPGMTCSGLLHAHFRAVSWETPPAHGNPENLPFGDEMIIGTDSRLQVEVRIPPASLEGTARLLMGDGARYHIEYGPLPGDVARAGNRFGTLYVYEPNQSPAGSGHHKSLSFAPDRTSWELVHGETSMPGFYTYRVVLLAPSVGETIWRFTISVHEFLPRIVDHGFVYPPRLYDHSWNYE